MPAYSLFSFEYLLFERKMSWGRSPRSFKQPVNDPSAHPTEQNLQAQTSAWIQLILPQHQKDRQELNVPFLLIKIKCFSGPSHLWTTASLQGQLPASFQSSKEGDRVGSQGNCLLLADPAGQQVWNDQNQLLPWSETGLPGETCHAQGFGLGDFPVRHMQVVPRCFSLHLQPVACSVCCGVDFVSKSTFLSLCYGTALLAQAASTSTGLGLLGKEVSYNKHIEGKNSGKLQVSKILPPFPGTSVHRTLLSSSIMGQNVLIFGWRQPHSITPHHWQLDHMEP